MAALLIAALFALLVEQNAASGPTFLTTQEKDERVARCESLGFGTMIIRTFEMYVVSVECKSVFPVAGNTSYN